MLPRRHLSGRFSYLLYSLAGLSAAIIFADGKSATAQVINQAVGGVAVNVDGVLSAVDLQHSAELAKMRQMALASVPGDMNQPTKLRMISLRNLDETIASLNKANQPIPDEAKYLAGLQRVQFVFVDPDSKDVILAGPAEGWKIDALGNVVGATSGRPVLHLDDLLVALRCADAARKGGISVSMDPTPEGLARWKAYRESLKTIGPDPKATIVGLEEAMGAQNISINGVPNTSRFASVLVAADYRMKRLAMAMEPLPIKGMQNYMQLIGATGPAANTMPRWWLAPKYDPILSDVDGLSWELRGPGVQAMAEEDMFLTGGDRVKVASAGSPAVHKWAESLTSHFEELSAKDPVFAELRNCMDMAVVGALIMKEQLLEKAQLKPQFLYDARQLTLEQYNPPKQVDSKASYIRKGKDWIICISGGVQFQPWEIVQHRESSQALEPVRSSAVKARAKSWWWNGDKAVASN